MATPNITVVSPKIHGSARDHERLVECCVQTGSPPLGGPKIALRGGVALAPGEGGGGGVQKWASVPGPLFCVRTDVATKGARTQIFPHICVVKMISATWGSF